MLLSFYFDVVATAVFKRCYLLKVYAFSSITQLFCLITANYGWKNNFTGNRTITCGTRYMILLTISPFCREHYDLQYTPPKIVWNSKRNEVSKPHPRNFSIITQIKLTGVISTKIILALNLYFINLTFPIRPCLFYAIISFTITLFPIFICI